MDNQSALRNALLNEYWSNNTHGIFKTKIFYQLNKSEYTTAAKINKFNLNLGKEDCLKIKTLCGNSDVLLFNFYSTLFSVLVYRYFNYSQINFISPVAQFEATKENKGFFLFRSAILENQSFKEIFSNNKKLLIDSLNYVSPLSDIEQNIEKDALDVFLEFGFIINKPDFKDEKYNPELCFKLSEDVSDPSLLIEYCTTRFDENIIELFTLNFNKLLTEVVQKIYAPVHELDMISDLERGRLNEFNLPESSFALDKNLLGLIEKQTILSPDKPALKYKNQVILYAELSSRSNQFAVFLRGKFDVSDDFLFGIMMERSITMAECILSVWKSGGAYVPIDQNYPDEHILKIIHSSDVSVVIVDNSVSKEKIKALGANVFVVNLDEIRDEVSQLPADKPAENLKDNNLSYVIYTSGSTGQPKGVMIEHGGMLNHIGAKIAALNIDTNGIVAQNATHTFDISVWQFFSGLIAGGTTVIYENELVLDPVGFVAAIDSDGVTILELVPSYLIEILDIIEKGLVTVKFSNLKMLVLNAETLMPSMVKRWLALYPMIPIVNTYGITEVSDDISHYVMRSCPDTVTIPVLKRPIQHAEINIVDAHMRLVPIGAIGEILVSGLAVGRGYLNDPDRTKAVFLNGPLEEIPYQGRIYKTGDLAFWHPDGTMEFLGRKDSQVKVKGNRIELGEIEHAMMEIPAIKNVKVVLNDALQVIVAYYQSETVLAKDKLTQFLHLVLPAYMIPSHFLHLYEMPLTPNGKIDKKSLPEPLLSDKEQDYLPARNETEEKLIKIWEALLERERIGITDSFFELGGHSLKATRLISLIHKEFGVKVSLKEVFANPVLEKQAKIIAQSLQTSYVEIEAQATKGSYVLSSSQRRLWILSQFEQANIAYNISGIYVFEGKLDIVSLEYAFEQLISRHEILRTVFREGEREGERQDEEIRQFILPATAGSFKIDSRDVRGSQDQETTIKQLIQEDISRPFDLAAGPLLRAVLYQVSAEKWVFNCTMHHIISDGWSMGILIRELLDGYNGHLQGNITTLAPLRIQYKDYAFWQQQQLKATSQHAHKAYWLNQFSGELPVLELPVDHNRPAVRTNNGSVLHVNIEEKHRSGLTSLGQQYGCTLFMGLLGVVNILLYRYSGQEDIIIGSPVAGREHLDLENQIGFYINTLALRTCFSGTDSFVDLLGHVRGVTLDGYEHQVYPFDELVEELNLQRDMSRSALFDVMVVLQNNESFQDEQGLEGLTVTGYEGRVNQSSKFDLTFTFTETEAGIRLSVEYNNDIYERKSIERLSVHFLSLLDAVLQAPSQAIQELDYLSPAEQQELLSGFNNTAVAYPQDQTIADLFREQVLKTPDRIALVFETQELTYRELDERSNQLAHYLDQQYGVQANELIGVLLDRSEWLLIVILGILKSGGAYLPIDPEYPKERIDYLLEDSDCKRCIDQSMLAQFQAVSDSYKRTDLKKSIRTEDLAYVIYTSGSTGNPKGVMVEHRNLNRLFKTAEPIFDFNAEDVWTLFHSYCFDFSVWEIFGALLYGGKLIVIPSFAAKDPGLYSSILEQQRVTILNQTPSSFDNLIKEELQKEERQLSLRYVIFGGEALSPRKLKKWKERYPACKLINMYGITETTVHVTYKEITAKEISENRSNIGKPIPTVSTYVLDKNQRLLPVGVWGELYVGGAGVARGYINKEELTNQRFIVNPFENGGRLYRSGDCVRILANGEMEYIGRTDDQVKIRGYRIELGEIEIALQSFPAMNSVSVLAKANVEGDQELIAYVVSNKVLNTIDLRLHLGKILPGYMVPGHFIQLEHLPLTSNGKIDKKALPSPQGTSLSTGTVYVAPRNETEEKLIQIWQDLLGQSNIGIHDNFFDLGGNSLKAIRLISLIHKEFDVRFKIENIYKSPVISELSSELSDIKWVMSSDTNNPGSLTKVII